MHATAKSSQRLGRPTCELASWLGAVPAKPSWPRCYPPDMAGLLRPLFLTLALLSCTSGQVTVRRYEAPVTPPPKGPGCPIVIVRWPLAPDSIIPLAVLDYRSQHGYLAAQRSDVERQLVAHACALGATGILMDREEYARPYVGTDVTATAFIHRAVAAPNVVRPAECAPPCSPGYFCQAGLCLAECNPPCGPGRTCSADRVCR